MQQGWLRITGQTIILVAIFLFATFSLARAQVRMISPAQQGKAPVRQPSVHSKTTPKTVSAPHLQPSKSKVAKAFPHLVVAKIWLDGQNSIHCNLKNRGKGFLSKADHGRGKLRISCCRQVKICGLKSVDPGHALLKPHGQISFNTHLKMTCTDNVAAKIFFTGKMPAVITRNSRFTVRLQPKHIRNSEKTKSRKSLHKPSVLQAESLDKPALHIQKIYLKKGTIHIRIRKNDFGRLSKKDYEQGKVVLHYSGKTKSWRLKDVDPRGKLNRPGKEVFFDTGINLNKKGVVKASIEKIKMHPVKMVRLSPEKALQTPLSTLPGTQSAAGMVPRDFEHPLANPKEPLTSLTETHKAGSLTQTAHQVYYPGLDIRLFDEPLAVEFDKGDIRIHYFCDPSIYRGPVEFHLKATWLNGDKTVIAVDETFTDQDSSDGFAGIAFTWPSRKWLLKMSYELIINPRHTLYETNYANNRKTGYLYKGGEPHIEDISIPFLPWDFQSGPAPQDIVMTRWGVHDALVSGLGTYDPYTKLLFIDVSFYILNPSHWDRTFNTDTYAKAGSSYKQAKRVEAGGWERVTAKISLKLQKRNYITVLLDGRMYLYARIKFRGLPYDPTASLDGPLYVSPNQHYAGSNGGIFNFSIRGGDSPWHITSDDPAFQPHPDTLDDNSNFSHLWDGNGYFFQVVVPPHSTPKMVNYIIKDALNHTVAARLWIFPSR